MENTNTPNNDLYQKTGRKFLIAEIVLVVIATLFFVIAALTANSAIKVLKKASGIIGGIIMLPLFIIAAFISLSLSIVSMSISAIGYSKTKYKKQIIPLVFSALLIVGNILAIILTLVVKI